MNPLSHFILKFVNFRNLQNYTTLKRILYPLNNRYSFRDLQNYTTLKRFVARLINLNGFRDLQNYTTLKPKL